MAQKRSPKASPGRKIPVQNASPSQKAAASIPKGNFTAGQLPEWMLHPLFTYIGLGAVVVFLIWIRAQHFNMPLERDEGEFGYIAQEILRGNWPYVSAYTQKLPGTYLVYTLFVGLFGATATAIHVGLLLTNIAIVWVLYKLGQKLFDPLAGLTMAFAWTVMAAAPNLMGFAGHATFFIALFGLLGLWALLEADERPTPWRFALAGLAFGTAFLMKQPAVFLTPFAIVWLAIEAFVNKRFPLMEFLKRAFILGAGSLIPYLLTMLVYVIGGHFDAFWFWTFSFAREFVGQVTGEIAAANFSTNTGMVIHGFTLAWVLAGAGLAASFFYVKEKRQQYLWPLFVVASFMTVVPGYYFTTHYFLSFLPALVLMLGLLTHAAFHVGQRFMKQDWLGAIPSGLVFISMVIGMSEYKLYYFPNKDEMDASQLAHAIYGTNPFPEAQALGEYIAKNSTEKDQLAVMGSEPQMYFYSGLRAATPSVVTYYMTAEHSRNLEMQEEMIRDFETNKPRYLAYISVPTSWMFKKESPRRILDWFNTTVPPRYDAVALAEIQRTPEGIYTQTVYKWGAEVNAYERQSTDYIVLFKRKE